MQVGGPTSVRPLFRKQKLQGVKRTVIEVEIKLVFVNHEYGG